MADVGLFCNLWLCGGHMDQLSKLPYFYSVLGSLFSGSAYRECADYRGDSAYLFIDRAGLVDLAQTKVSTK